MHKESLSREGGMFMMSEDGWKFKCQNLLDPDVPSKTRFFPEMVRYYDNLPENLKFYLLLYPANARKKKSDYTAMLVVGVDFAGNYYIADMLRDKLSPDEKISKAVRSEEHTS